MTESLQKADNLAEKSKDFDYINLWLGELYYLKSIVQICSVKSLISKKQQEVTNRYDKVRLMNLEDLIKKNR